MTDKQQPKALRIADELEEPMTDFPQPTKLEAEAAAELRRLHAELETLRIGYAAARLEIESLRAAQPAGAQQPNTTYAALPDDGEPWHGHRFKEVQHGCWKCDCGKTLKEVTADQAAPATGDEYPLMPRRYTVDDDGEDLFTAEKMRAFADATCALRASHGQAPAQPVVPAFTEAQIASACLSYRHDFGLLGETDRKSMMWIARQWERAFAKEREFAAPAQPAPYEIINMAREQGLPETEIEGVFRVNVDDLGRMFAADRAALAKWGRPAHSGEPVAWLDPWTGAKVTTDYDAYGEHGIALYTAPQPVEREPLTHAQAKALVLKYGNDPLHLVLQVERAHGIKGGKHGAE